MRPFSFVSAFFLAYLAAAAGPDKVHGWMIEIPLCAENSRAYIEKLKVELTEEGTAILGPDGNVQFTPDGRLKLEYKNYRIESPNDAARAVFGGGNYLNALSVTPLKCGGFNQLGEKFDRPSDKHYYEFSPQALTEKDGVEVGRLMGFISNTKTSKVRGEATLDVPFAHQFNEYVYRRRRPKGPNGDYIFSDTRPPGPANPAQRAADTAAKQNWWRENLAEKPWIELVLSVKNADGTWREVKKKSLNFLPFIGGLTSQVIEAEVEPRSVVKFSLVTNLANLARHENDKDAEINIRLHDAKLFGAQCYPDFANPDGCLGDKTE